MSEYIFIVIAMLLPSVLAWVFLGLFPKIYRRGMVSVPTINAPEEQESEEARQLRGTVLQLIRMNSVHAKRIDAISNRIAELEESISAIHGELAEKEATIKGLQWQLNECRRHRGLAPIEFGTTNYTVVGTKKVLEE
jgi:hypothetical protein